MDRMSHKLAAISRHSGPVTGYGCDGGGWFSLHQFYPTGHDWNIPLRDSFYDLKERYRVSASQYFDTMLAILLAKSGPATKSRMQLVVGCSWVTGRCQVHHP